MRRIVRPKPGHRGSFLLFLAILDFVYAWALLKATTPQQAAEDLLLPWAVWAGIWSGVGLICLISAFMKKDRLAFSMAASIKFAWAAVSLVGWLRHGQPNGWLSAVIWLAFSGTVLIISDWPEPSPPPRTPPLPERFSEEDRQT